MTAHWERNNNVRLLACLIDEDDTYDSDYRFVIDGQHVKYAIAAPSTFRGSEDNRTFEPILLGELLPPFPPGVWNRGYLARDPETDKAAFVKTERIQLAGVQNCWHHVKLNELEFTRQDRVRQRVHTSTHPHVHGGKPVLVKLAVWPWEIPAMERETAAYQWISGAGVGPCIPGPSYRGQRWTRGRVGRRVLGRLHALGIKMGEINKHNFLVRDGHDVVLVDFETAKRDCSPGELEDEMKRPQEHPGRPEFPGWGGARS